MPEKFKSEIAVIGIDIGKNSFHIVGQDRGGSIVLRQKWSRGQVEARLANLPPCLIGMEACSGAHHLSRKLQALGHDARLMPAKYVRPYSKGEKNDYRDAEAIAEAVQRPTMKLHVIEDLAGDWRRLDERIEALSDEIMTLARQDKGCERLMTVPGIGPIISSAMVAAIGSGDAFSKGRDFGAWLGLVPKQMSTGDRTILGSISKRGNRYLRTLFVQAAWVVLVKVGPEGGSATGSSRGSRRRSSACTAMCWRSRSLTNSPGSPGRYLLESISYVTCRLLKSVIAHLHRDEFG
jgi:transposase